LEGASNHNPWKARVTLFFMENGVVGVFQLHGDPIRQIRDLAGSQFEGVKARRFSLDAVKGSF